MSKSVRGGSTSSTVWADPVIVQRALHNLPWGVNVQLLDSINEPAPRLDAARATNPEALGYGP